MALPDDRASSTPVPAALLPPDDIARIDLRVDYELGGVAVGDATQGMQVQAWRAWVDGTTINVAPHPAGAPVTAVLTAANVTELSLSFDQLMRPTLAFMQAGTAKLYWYDSLLGAQTTTSFPGAESPMVCLDEKRPFFLNAGLSDVLFIYVIDGELRYRQQRERFAVERVLASLGPGVRRITGVGMGANSRLQINMAIAPALHVDLAEDQMYASDATGAVRPVQAGAIDTARWRSRVFEAHEVGSLGWAKVDAASYPVTLTVLGDAVVVATITVTSDEPLRLPAIRAREWEVEVSGTARVLSVRLAEVREELEQDDGSNL